MDKDKMHRVVKIATGEVSEVSALIASDPKMLLEYGFMLQELEEEEEPALGLPPLEEPTGEVSEGSDENKHLENIESENSVKPKRTYNKNK